MRYIDKSNCKSMNDRENKVDKEIKSLGALTRTATRIAEEKKLGLLKTRLGIYRIIKECGLGGACDRDFTNLAEVDAYLKNEAH